VVTFLATVQFGHSFGNCDSQWKQSNKCGQEWKHFYFVKCISHRISTEKIASKIVHKMLRGYILCTQNTVATKVYTFPLHGYIFGDIPKPCTQFHAELMWLYTKACHPYVCTSISCQWILLG